MSVWGYLAYRAGRTWLWVAAGALVFLIGLSRIYLGVHFPHDVVFGWLLGGALVWCFLKVEPRATAWARQRPVLMQVGAGLALSVAVVVVGQSIQAWLAGTPDPQAWSALAAAARTPATAFGLAGALFGAIAGYALMNQRARFQSTGPWLKRGGRYGLGIAGTLLIYFGLDVVFGLLAADETPVGYALRYVRYAAATFWVTFLAPWLFLKTRLAEREPQLADSGVL